MWLVVIVLAVETGHRLLFKDHGIGLVEEEDVARVPTDHVVSTGLRLFFAEIVDEARSIGVAV